MNCPYCLTENPESYKFCRHCRCPLQTICRQCGFENLPLDQFCGRCGATLETEGKATKTKLPLEKQRKNITVLFSDLSDYTSINEKLDPEEVNELMARIFGEISRVITLFAGHIEKFIGDAVMAVFGIPRVQEDDAVRAIGTALEIHAAVASLSRHYENRTGRPLRLHSGISTGLVVLGEFRPGQGDHGFTGDTVNVASRLKDLASKDEILVGPETFRLSQRFFEFKELGPTEIRGRQEKIAVYQVRARKNRPTMVHGISGLRSELIGRKGELAQLVKAVGDLKSGKRGIIAISGEAGTGKSRLVEELKNTVDQKTVQWFEGFGFSFSQIIPYFLLVDLINHSVGIEKSDNPDRVKEKLEKQIGETVTQREKVVPFLGSLYNLPYPETEGISPELWKDRLQQAVYLLLSILGEQAPTVVVLEDIHWADPSSIELLRSLLTESRIPSLFILTFRPPFSPFTSYQERTLAHDYREVSLGELSPEESQAMVESLLQTRKPPEELRQLIREKSGGNPFFIEEMANTMIELGSLQSERGNWSMTRPCVEADPPLTIQGVIAARLDVLDPQVKRVLQEASVLGRFFPLTLLKKITETPEQLDSILTELERIDLIRKRSQEPELEFMFKHAFIHEVAYQELLLTERQQLHEKVALIIESLYKERLIEFYETLAYHFDRSQSISKAIHYLIRAGIKSLNRHAVEESHRHFQRAFDLISVLPKGEKHWEELFIELLIRWAFVFHYLGDFSHLEKMLREHEHRAVALEDPMRLGMYYTQMGLALYQTEQILESYQVLQRALKLGEEIGDARVIAYACSHLSWVCPELGLLDEGLERGRQGIDLAREFPTDEFLVFNTWGGMGLNHYFRGDRQATEILARKLLEFGRQTGNNRSLVLGHFISGCAVLITGRFPEAIACFEQAVRISADPWFSQFPRLLLGLSYLSNKEIEKAEEAIQPIIQSNLNNGTYSIRTPARMLEGLLCLAKGNLKAGMKIIEQALESHRQKGRLFIYASAEELMGRVYFQIMEGGSTGLSLTRELAFLFHHVPFAGQKAEDHFNRSIRTARAIGAQGILGTALMNLGLLYRLKKKRPTNA